MANTSYGDAFGRRFGVRQAPALVSRALRKSDIAVTYLRQDSPSFAFSEPQPVEDGYLISIGLTDFPDYRLWEDGRPLKPGAVAAPQLTMYDLRTAPYILVNQPMVGLHFHVPRFALDAAADGEGAARVGELNFLRGVGIDDPTMHHLAAALMPAFRRPEETPRLFVDHVTLAAVAHLAVTYGGMRTEPLARGGLAPWQQRLATEMIDDCLDGEVSHAAIARRLGISPSHFARAFRVSTGLPPHQWLMRRRIEKARALLRETKTPLAEVSHQCGFATQSHFTRVFTRLTGASPGAWRRGVRA